MKTPHSPIAGPRPDILCLLQEGGGVTLNPEAVIPVYSDAALVWDTKHYTLYDKNSQIQITQICGINSKLHTCTGVYIPQTLSALQWSLVT